MSSLVSAAARALAVPELLSEIVALLDRASLAQTALVSRAWKVTSERVLYGAVKVDAREYQWEHELPRLRALLATLAGRPDLARRIARLELHADGQEFQHHYREGHFLHMATRLMVQCSGLAQLKLEGDNVLWFVPVAAVHSARLTHLHIVDHHDFAALAPFLPALAQLTSLELGFCVISRDETLDWPEPTFTLTNLLLDIGMQYHDPLPSLADFEWFTRSSRYSLRHLTLQGVFGNEFVGETHTQLANLEVASLDLRGFVRHAGGDLKLLTRLGGLPRLRRLEVWVADDPDWVEPEDVEEGRTIRRVAGEVNRKLEKELVVFPEWPVTDDDSESDADGLS